MITGVIKTDLAGSCETDGCGGTARYILLEGDPHEDTFLCRKCARPFLTPAVKPVADDGVLMACTMAVLILVAAVSSCIVQW